MKIGGVREEIGGAIEGCDLDHVLLSSGKGIVTCLCGFLRAPGGYIYWGKIT